MKHEETARRLKKAMEEKNITQRELSKKANISEASISQYFNGSHKPSNISAGKMAEILDVNPMWLMGFDVDMNNSKKKIPEYNHDHLELIELYEATPKSEREKLMNIVKLFAGTGGIIMDDKDNN